MNRIMELADEYAETSAVFPTLNSASYYAECSKTRAALATEVQAQQDYTRAVIAERDELMEDCEQLRDNYQHACNLVANMHAAAVGYIGGPEKGVIEDVLNLRRERDALRKAAQMAEVALHKALHTNAPFGWDATKALAALRKELGQ